MEDTTTQYTCEKCGKQRVKTEGSFLDQEKKKFCCEECCTKDADAEAGLCTVC